MQCYFRSLYAAHCLKVKQAERKKLNTHLDQLFCFTSLLIPCSQNISLYVYICFVCVGTGFVDFTGSHEKSLKTSGLMSSEEFDDVGFNVPRRV